MFQQLKPQGAPAQNKSKRLDWVCFFWRKSTKPIIQRHLIVPNLLESVDSSLPHQSTWNFKCQTHKWNWNCGSSFGVFDQMSKQQAEGFLNAVWFSAAWKQQLLHLWGNSADAFSLVMNIKERTVFAATMPQENGSHCKSILSQHEGCSSWVRRVIVRSFSESSYSSEVLKTSEKNVFFQRRGVCWILSVSPKTAEDMQHNEAKSLLPARTPATMSLEGRPRQASHQSGWLAIWKRP